MVILFFTAEARRRGEKFFHFNMFFSASLRLCGEKFLQKNFELPEL
jgi:hypothetical protein